MIEYYVAIKDGEGETIVTYGPYKVTVLDEGELTLSASIGLLSVARTDAVKEAAWRIRQGGI